MRKANRLGCLTVPAFLATVFTLLILTGTVFANGSAFFSPGDLSARSGAPLGNIRSHAQIANNCEQCHTALWDTDSMQDRCVRCHTTIGEEMADVHKLHGILRGADAVLECRKCHPEHRGAGETLTDVTLHDFPHELIGFSTTSHHSLPDGSEFTCQNCHVKDYRSFKTSDCADCHRKTDIMFTAAHTQQYGAECRDCHDGKETIDKEFDHSQTAFPLVDFHTTLKCSNCHANSHSLAEFKKTPAKCVDCHLKDDPHGENFGTTCDACHTQKSWTDIDGHFDHSVTGFKLVGKHENVKCENCHTTPKQFKNTPSTCVGCHQKDDKHAGTEGTACENCHTSAGWKPSTFNHFNAFVLDGKHATLLCEKCHTTPFQFKNAPGNCVGCHQKDDVHAGGLGINCSSCHNTSAWKPASFNHNLSAFKLNGAHNNVQCTQCHINGKFKGTPMTCVGCHQKDDKHAGTEGTACETCHTTIAWKPSTFNHFNVFVLNGKHATLLCQKCHTTPFQFKNAPMTCVGCHQKDDAHAGAFGTACSNCHSTTAWKPATFDHNLSAFKLNGKHVSVQCAQCHINGKFKGTPKTCVGCHLKNDVHAGAEGTACETCHTTTGWKPSTFNHFNVFALTGKHATLLCQKCHLAAPKFNNTPMTCVGCHLKNDIHAGSFGTACSTCHNTTAWKPATFNHNLAAFKLTGAHVSVLCAKCHTTPGKFKGTPMTCVGCHSAKDVHAGTEGTACQSCHTTTAWKPSTFNHNNAAFKLAGAHVSVLCARCHTTPGKFKGTPMTCVGCHKAKDVHAGTEGTACESCHTSTAWKPSTFNHNNAAFKLTGAHVSVLCAKCHTTPGRFKGTPMDCVSCHLKNDAHAGAFGTACSTCHTTTAWKPATFDHNLSAFKLTGKHTTVACASCHISGVFKGTPMTCVGCHLKKDVHAGGEGTACQNCHTTSGWKPSTFNHSTVFNLVGAHTTVLCAKCHLTAPKFNNTPTTCFACHKARDVHAGTEGTACESCHTPTAWKPSTFNHNNAAFKLTGAHVSAICARCHTTPNIFKGISSSCVSCHLKNDAHAGAFGTNCGACHGTTAWKPATFDHNLSAFKLTGKHTTVGCTSCHINGVFKGTPTACASCHQDPAYHAGLFPSQACSNCHTTSAWRPATYNGPHTFPMNHGRSTNTCATCHQPTLKEWTCYTCHNQTEITRKHQEKGISNFSDCMRCHANGKSD